MNEHKILAIIILNWNQYIDTIGCIRSILEKGWDSKDLFIIDNGSINNSVEIISKSFTENLNLIMLDKNIGFAAGMNHGLMLAINSGYKYALLLNNDTMIFQPGVLEAYSDAFSMDPSIGVVTAKIMNDEKGVIEQKDPIINSKGLMKFAYTYIFPPYKPISDKNNSSISSGNLALEERTMLHGVAMAVKLEIISKVGYFNEDFFCYEEDRDFMIRVREKGYKLVLLNDYWIYHKWSGSTRRNSDFVIYYKTRNLRFMFNRYYSYRFILFSYIKLLLVSLKNGRILSYFKGITYHLKKDD